MMLVIMRITFYQNGYKSACNVRLVHPFLGEDLSSHGFTALICPNEDIEEKLGGFREERGKLSIFG